MVVLGGTGYVGRKLVPALQASGRRVRVASRRPSTQAIAGVESVRCDLESGEGVDQALEGADLAYFLVHGMAAGRGFAAREKIATENFVRAARRQGVARVIYLGGLYPDGDLSDHLESRRQVGLMLIEGTGALAIRAGVVVGLGGASFDILYALCQRLPLMIAPRWLASLCQPVSIEDTVRGLAGAAGIPGGRELDLVGPDVLTYRAMLEITAVELRGRKPIMFPVPLLSPELSAHWLRLVARVDMNVARSLVASLRHNLVAERPLLTTELGLTPVGFQEAVRTALAERRGRGARGDGRNS
ncbi:MAG: NAD(P)H-binding protein [Candidatus Dormibacteraceae bacterium]